MRKRRRFRRLEKADVERFQSSLTSPAAREVLREMCEALRADLAERVARLNEFYDGMLAAIERCEPCDRSDPTYPQRRAAGRTAPTSLSEVAQRLQDDQEREIDEHDQTAAEHFEGLFPFELMDPRVEEATWEVKHETGQMEPAAIWAWRYGALRDDARWLVMNRPDLFAMLERVSRMMTAGAVVGTLPSTPKDSGRPTVLGDITDQLESLRKDDDARRLLRQAVSSCVDSARVSVRQQRKQQRRRLSTEELAAERTQRYTAYSMLRQELDMAATGIRLPRLANVLLVLLDDRDVDRNVLRKAADAARVLKSGADKRKNLADLISATRRELKALPPNVRWMVERSAWRWDRADDLPGPTDDATLAVYTGGHAPGDAAIDRAARDRFPQTQLTDG